VLQHFNNSTSESQDLPQTFIIKSHSKRFTQLKRLLVIQESIGSLCWGWVASRQAVVGVIPSSQFYPIGKCSSCWKIDSNREEFVLHWKIKFIIFVHFFISLYIWVHCEVHLSCRQTDVAYLCSIRQEALPINRCIPVLRCKIGVSLQTIRQMAEPQNHHSAAAEQSPTTVYQ